MTFSPAFSKTPTVVIGLQEIDQTSPKDKEDNYAWDLKAKSVTRQGFQAELEMYDRIINKLHGAWIACTH